ncbi:hypothetical protein OAH18_01165 [bacterium]|nr:hypothetical protein [bacterium]
MKSTFRQQIGWAFCIASAIASVFCDYVWAYHFAAYDPKFPTPWGVFTLSLQISIVIVCITTVLFVLPLFTASGFRSLSPTASDHATAAGLGVIVQPVIFVSPHVTDRLNPLPAVLFIAPVLAGFVFVAIRRRNPPSGERHHD